VLVLVLVLVSELISVLQALATDGISGTLSIAVSRRSRSSLVHLGTFIFLSTTLRTPHLRGDRTRYRGCDWQTAPTEQWHGFKVAAQHKPKIHRAATAVSPKEGSLVVAT